MAAPSNSFSCFATRATSMPMALASSARSDSLYVAIGVELSRTEREESYQTNIMARHYINRSASLRKGALGQHCALSKQLRQSRVLAKYRSVSPSLTGLPVVLRILPAGQTYTLRSLSNVKSFRLNVPSSRFDLSITGICGAIFFS